MIWALYHDGDADGHCSGAIMRFYHQLMGTEVRLEPLEYGQEFDLSQISPADTVYLADFSLQPLERMLELAAACQLVWIDHHQSALDFAAEHQELQGARGLRRIGSSAAELAWEYFYSADSMPEAVRLIGRFDVWDESDPELWRKKIMPFQFGLRSLETDPREAEPLWDPLLRGDAGVVERIRADGVPIVRFTEKTNRERAVAHSYETMFEGFRAIALNSFRANSQAFDAVWDPLRHDMMISYGHDGDRWTVSLYTKRDDVDCAAIATKRGGGGHKQASGFITEELPFKPEVLPELVTKAQGDGELRSRKLSQKEVERMQAGLELDLVAYYGQLENEALELLEEAVNEGWTTDELIRRADQLLA